MTSPAPETTTPAPAEVAKPATTPAAAAFKFVSPTANKTTIGAKSLEINEGELYFVSYRIAAIIASNINNSANVNIDSAFEGLTLSDDIKNHFREIAKKMNKDAVASFADTKIDTIAQIIAASVIVAIAGATVAAAFVKQVSELYVKNIQIIAPISAVLTAGLIGVMYYFNTQAAAKAQENTTKVFGHFTTAAVATTPTPAPAPTTGTSASAPTTGTAAPAPRGSARS